MFEMRFQKDFCISGTKGSIVPSQTPLNSATTRLLSNTTLPVPLHPLLTGNCEEGDGDGNGDQRDGDDDQGDRDGEEGDGDDDQGDGDDDQGNGDDAEGDEDGEVADGRVR